MNKLIAILAILMMGAGLKLPIQPERITKNDPGTIDRAVMEIYHRVGVYLDSLPYIQTGTKYLKDADSTVFLGVKYADTSYQIFLGWKPSSVDGTYPYIKSKTDSSFVARCMPTSSMTGYAYWLTMGRRKR